MKIVFVDKTDVEVSNVTQSLSSNDDKVRLMITCKTPEDIIEFSKHFSDDNVKILNVIRDGSVIKTYEDFTMSNISEQINEKEFSSFVNVDMHKDIVKNETEATEE